jgi:rhodanese-related sulfurtransferase
MFNQRQAMQHPPAHFLARVDMVNDMAHLMRLSRPIPALIAALLCASLALPAAHAESESPAVKAMLEYFDFTEYSGGVIFPEQIEAADYPRFFIVDTRMESQFAAGALPGAISIEWRQLLARRNELPRDRAVLIYCHTGMLSAQAAFALRLAGWDNVKVLQGGYLEWQRKGGVDAARQAAGAR